ncbi:hypothetical protein BJY27_008131 [Streptomyces rapamycinicus]|uniref:Uncharacterized protein n=2 Tax=Streptomyces rapamycinicus TaxID=1226757 RepID=A0A3L8RCS0_STRRN|nr:hypothetical protein [Streptomyces rapamycinicus]RLV77391.1 hypothetical protein D3C57_103440 [Streptomyces rapamycinicus NRRL 5491]
MSVVLDVSGMIDVPFVHSVGLGCLPDAEARAPEPGTGLDGWAGCLRWNRGNMPFLSMGKYLLFCKCPPAWVFS